MNKKLPTIFFDFFGSMPIIHWVAFSQPMFGHSPKGIEMLVLSRKEGEKIVINENIVITVICVDPNKVKIGIEAPKNIPVDRYEIFEDKNRSQGLSKNICSSFFPCKIA